MTTAPHHPCIRPCPSGWRVTIKRHLPDHREMKYVAVFPTLDKAILARDAYNRDHPSSVPARVARPQPAPPPPVVRPAPDLRESVAVAALIAYREADLRLASLARSDPGWPAARDEVYLLDSDARLALRRWGGHHWPKDRRTGWIRAGGWLWRLDEVGELQKVRSLTGGKHRAKAKEARP